MEKTHERWHGRLGHAVITDLLELGFSEDFFFQLLEVFQVIVVTSIPELC